MSLFGKILEKLGLKRRDVPDASKPPAGSSGPGPGQPPIPAWPAPSTPGPIAAPQPVPISEVDVVTRLEKLAAANPQKLNWKTSIVDLLKLLDLDSSFAARKDLAQELGCPPEKMGDSAQMNMWLHKTVLRKLAENGGNIPRELLD